MSKNSKHIEEDILKIWEKAGRNLSERQQLNKEKMENIISKTSNDFSAGMQRLLKADAIIKVGMLFGFIIIAAFNLANLFVLVVVLACIIIGVVSLKQERVLIEGLKDLQEYKGSIRNYMEENIHYYQANIFRYSFVLSISIFLFYVLGGMVYHAIRYENIRPIEDLEDGIVLISFLLFSVIFSFAVYYPFFKSRINFLKTLVDDIDSTELIRDHLENQKVRKRWTIIITFILILAGIIALVSLILAYF